MPAADAEADVLPAARVAVYTARPRVACDVCHCAGLLRGGAAAAEDTADADGAATAVAVVIEMASGLLPPSLSGNRDNEEVAAAAGAPRGRLGCINDVGSKEKGAPPPLLAAEVIAAASAVRFLDGDTDTAAAAAAAADKELGSGNAAVPLPLHGAFGGAVRRGEAGGDTGA